MPRLVRNRNNSKSRAAAAEQKRLRRAQMSEEELKKVRAAEAERARKKRAQMTAEAIEKQRARDAAKKREKRLSCKSEEELQRIRARDAAKKRERRSSFKSEGEIQKMRAREAAKRREKRTLNSEGKTPEAKARAAELKRLKRAKMTEEEREKIKARSLETMRKRKAQMTEEERKIYNAQRSEYCRRRNARMTEEERKRFKAKKAERWKWKENEQTVENIRKMISLAGELGSRQPGRFRDAGTFVKNSLSDILSLHGEIAKMRENVKETVAEAVKNAVSLHRIEKQTRAEGYRSLTFVGIWNPKRTIKQEVTTEEVIEPDPLMIVQPVIQNEEEQVSNEKTNENYETFNVCTYTNPSACEGNSAEMTNSIKFACSICSKKFETSLGLIIHQKQHSADNSVEFKCSLCPQMFNSYNLTTTHYLEVHSFEFVTNEMNNEDEAEETDEVLERHRHEFEFSFFRKCLVCFQTFDQERLVLSTFRNHVIHDHSENQELLKHFAYSCARCEKPFAVLRSLECHWKTFCYENWKNENDVNSRGIVCEICGMRFSNEKSLRSHTTVSHAEKEKVVCEQCGKGYTNLKLHIKYVHEAEMKFTCEHCGKACKTRQNLVTHTRLVHLGIKRFACKLCYRRFGDNAKLDAHMNSHTGEKPFKCKYCERCFSKKPDLKNHENRHESGTYKPRNIDENSTRHKRGANYGYDLTNFGANPKPDDGTRFGCSLCGKSFRFKNSYYRHKSEKHKGNPNAQLVRFTADTAETDAFANLLPTYNNNIPTTFYNPLPLQTGAGHSNVSSVSLEPQYSLGRDDYSSEMDYDNDINVDDISLPQFEELGNMNLQNNISLPKSTNTGHSASSQNPAFESSKTRDRQQSFPHSSSSYVDFSRANVPSGHSNNLTDDGSDTNVNQSKIVAKQEAVEINTNTKVFTEDPRKEKEDPKKEKEDPKKEKEVPKREKERFQNDSEVDVKDVVKIKIEAPDVVDDDDDDDDDYEPPKSVTTRRKLRQKRKTHTRKKYQKRKPTTSEKSEPTEKAKKLTHSDFDCLYCDKKNMSCKNIVAHCRKEHPGQKPLKCKQCPWMFNTIDTYYGHKNKKHNPPKPKPPPVDPNSKKEVICESCGKGFHTKQAMYVHRSVMHRGELEVECEICHKMIRGKGNMKLHRNRHLGIKPHLCEECGLGFATQGELKQHVRVVHRGEKKVPQTDKTHPYPCLLCPKRFAKEIRLREHQNLHDPERKYPCDVCGLRYRTYDIRYAHIKVKHRGIKYYVKKPRTIALPPDVALMYNS